MESLQLTDETKNKVIEFIESKVNLRWFYIDYYEDGRVRAIHIRFIPKTENNKEYQELVIYKNEFIVFNKETLMTMVKLNLNEPLETKTYNFKKYKKFFIINEDHDTTD